MLHVTARQVVVNPYNFRKCKTFKKAKKCVYDVASITSDTIIAVTFDDKLYVNLYSILFRV